MPTVRIRLDRATLKRTVWIGEVIFLMLSAVAESGTSSLTRSPLPDRTGSECATPPNWAGVYTTQSRIKGQHGGNEGTDAPPGFTTINPYRGLDEVVTSRLKPWALAKQQATDFDTEDTGALCEPSSLPNWLRHRGDVH